MYLCKNVDRQKSLPKPLPLKNCFSTRERPARTPPSTFLFLPIHFSNSPGIEGNPHLQKARRVVEAHASENHRIPFHCSSEELQRRVIAPTTSGWRADGRYIGFGFTPCQPQIGFSSQPMTIKLALYPADFRASGKSGLNQYRAALRP